MHTSLIRTACVVVLWLAVAVPAAGQTVINQAKANAGLGGCDTPGFPVTLCKSGPYKLTSNLTPTTPNKTMIEVATNVVTIDLNGFVVGGNCSLGSTSGDGITTSGVPRTQVAIINGVVSCMGSLGINLLGDWHRIERVTAVYNRFIGVRVGDGSIVKDSACSSNGTGGIMTGVNSVVNGNVTNNNINFGIHVEGGSIVTNNTSNGNQAGLEMPSGGSAASGYGTNVFTGNAFAVSGTFRQIGANLCNFGPCP